MTLKELRKAKGIKLRELAFAMGIGPQSISHYENCKRKFPTHLVKPYAEFFNTTTDEILSCLSKKK